MYKTGTYESPPIDVSTSLSLYLTGDDVIAQIVAGILSIRPVKFKILMQFFQ